jgi:tungstate transport system ATP-binding protein
MTLRADGVTRAYGDEVVFRDVDLPVPQGEVVAIIGPSGVGKSTLLRLLGLFTPPDEGSVAVDGTDAWSLPTDDRLALRRRVGVVFQEASLFDASVARNVEYGLRVRRSWRERVRDELRALVGTTELPDTARDALDVVGLADYVDKPADSLSGGEAQRVAFARALAYDPDFLLLDEPTSDLDPRNTAVIEDAMTAAAERDIGVVVATHDMNQAQRVADRVAVLLDDSVIESGPADRVFENPRDERARKFIDGELVY